MDQFYAILWSAVGIISTGFFTWLTARITAWLNTKIKDKKVAMWATDLTNIVMSSVQAVFQSFVDTLKKENKFDAEAQKEAKERAYKIIVSELTPELKKYIEDNFGDMREYLMNQIEAMIYILKN